MLDADMRRRIDRQRRNRRRNRFRRAVVRPVSRLWRYGIIPYLIDQSIGKNYCWLALSVADPTFPAGGAERVNLDFRRCHFSDMKTK